MKSKLLSLIFGVLFLAGGCTQRVAEKNEESFKIESRTNYPPKIEMIKSPRQHYNAGDTLELEFRVTDDFSRNIQGRVKYRCPPPYEASIIATNGEIISKRSILDSSANKYIREPDGRYSLRIEISDFDYHAINGGKNSSTSFFFNVEGLQGGEK
jgi:hypothetical protein